MAGKNYPIVTFLIILAFAASSAPAQHNSTAIVPIEPEPAQNANPAS